MDAVEMVIRAAEEHLGCPYVYGTWGQICTKALRIRYANYKPSQRAITYKRCQQLRPSNPTSSCDGCKYKGLLAFDCRGFTHYCLKLGAGIEISGQAVGSQWTTKANWAEQGDIAAMPDLVCCVFIKQSGKWKHTGLHLGGGRIIHCSVEVKEDTVGGERNWTHYAIPKGLYTDEEIKNAHKEKPIMRMLRKGAQGEDVKQLQEMLNKLGFSCGKADGIFGANTEAAVKAFQAVNALKADGIAGPQTLELLAARAADPDQPELPEDADEIDPPAAIQVDPVQLSTAREHIKKAYAILEKLLKEGGMEL